MASNTEKLACESCIRGHRVAKCQHTDRPLLRVSRKGRPVSQCDHCRTLRNSRSVHTKCKCASASHQAMLKAFGQERCLCDEGETCKCAHKTDRKNGKGIRSPLSTDKSSTPPTALSLSESKDRIIETSQTPARSCCAPSSTPPHDTTETIDPISISNLGMPNVWNSSDVVDTLGPSMLEPLPESRLQGQQNLMTFWDQAPDLGQGQAPMPIPTFDDPLSTMGPFEMGSLFNDIDISQINIPDEWVIRNLTSEPRDPEIQHNQL
ncbi:copper fist DNA binding domain-containing protein [Fusarium flagelliforme]|uniref:copper fist DNA binding domain-containing protein n=1 Tax=Fusarium flagelliforme TaxID=2675880 RepID=UPI001E8D45AE|nr:copper fist DNA binding domain-containing protein [Fusarium flagelliforme]KAH7193890.1 copper fist DNA binding domain-containing protein [Fusarium flagelliforme]